MALALGAKAVLVGRPCLHGLAVGGALGVAHDRPVVDLGIARGLHPLTLPQQGF
jgi:hypothetical protein